MDVSFIQNLENRLNQELPGPNVQDLMSPTKDEKYRVLSSDYKIACVLLLLFPKDKEWHISMIERTNRHAEDKHGGQISFPGGQLNESDDSYEDCALREAYEEIGVSPDIVGILGGLSPLFVFVSNFLVHPFVGFTTEYPKFIKQESEVKNILEVPLPHLLKPKTKGFSHVEVRGTILENTPFYDVYGHKVWGATAMMLSEFEHILKDIEF